MSYICPDVHVHVHVHVPCGVCVRVCRLLSAGPALKRLFMTAPVAEKLAGKLPP